MAKKVLIIDDDKFFQSMYRQEFGALGFEVSVAHDGVEGLEMVKSVMPDAIVLDLVMPKMTGFQVLEECKKDATCSKIPIVVLSGVASDEEIKRANTLGAVKAFSKLIYLPETIAKYVASGLENGFTPDLAIPEAVRVATVKEGEALNDIFREAAEKTHSALSQIFRAEVRTGNLQATMAPAKNLEQYLAEVADKFPDEVVVYSVLKPPVAAGLLSLKPNFVLKLTDVMTTKVAGSGELQDNVNESVKEFYNIVSNAFLNILTRDFHSDKSFLFNVPMLSTPDLALKLLRRDGFDLVKENIQFVFRQSYIFKDAEEEEEFDLELILIFSPEGLKVLSNK